MPIGRNRVFEIIGTKPRNPQWAWCAISPNYERVVFTLWADELLGDRYLLFRDRRTNSLNRSERDLKEKLDLAMEMNIPAYGLVCEARNVNAPIRKIGKVHADYLVKLRLQKDEEGIYAIDIGKVQLAEIVSEEKAKREATENNGLNDINSIPPGSESPDRAHVEGLIVKRDPKVRRYVIEQAEGKCEFCGKQGFQMDSGRRYLEAHHVITLSNQGADTVENVIALCPEHHREAHYGVNAEELEEQFLECINNRNG